MTARIFLLSHMRAYTSLLGHILGSHPAINGYYELHLSYTSAADLAKATQAYTAHDSLKPGSRYLFDKLLHNDYELNLAQLGLRDAVILCALRQAAPSIKSILHLFAKKSSNDLYAQPAEATKYYIQRLQTLAQFSQHYPRRYYYFDAELICADTPNMLDILRLWLQLDAPLESDYQTFSQTGVAGAGDSSPAIASGKVLNQTERYGDIVLAEDLSRQAIEAYQDCRFQLMTHARDVATH
jgi:hypothetical protein